YVSEMKSFNYYWRYLLQIFYSFLRKNCTKQKAHIKENIDLDGGKKCIQKF
ncbi:MAG: hypothetical protein CI949_2394, partial [Halanaerobium sp.]